jgi:hypothetical protein
LVEVFDNSLFVCGDPCLLLGDALSPFHLLAPVKSPGWCFVLRPAGCSVETSGDVSLDAPTSLSHQSGNNTQIAAPQSATNQARKAPQKQRSPKINPRGIFGVVRFSTVATISPQKRTSDLRHL